MRTRRNRSDWDEVWWGLILLAMGGMFLFRNLGILESTVLEKWWVVMPILFGIARLVGARTAKAVSEGVFLVLIGVWFLLTVSHWHGLSWHNSWPLALIALGASSVAESIASMFLPRRTPAEPEKEMES